MTREETSYPPWWQTMEADPWYITGAKAVLGEREVEQMRHGDPYAWAQNVALPLLFMGKGPKGRVMPELPRGGPELPPPPRLEPLSPRQLEEAGFVNSYKAEMMDFARFEDGLTGEHLALEDMLSKHFAAKGVDYMNPHGLRKAAFYNQMDNPAAYLKYLQDLAGGVSRLPTSRDQINLEGGDVMPIPGQPPLTMGQRGNILSGNVPKNINPKEDFSTFLPREEPPSTNPFKDYEPPPITNWGPYQIEPPSFEGIYPGVKWNPDTMRWDLPGRGTLGPLEGETPQTPKDWPLGTESWAAPPSKPPEETILPEYHDQIPFKWMDRGKPGPLPEQLQNELPPPPGMEPPPFTPPGDTSEPPTGYPPWWLTQNQEAPYYA
jgi:hypothetical protein